MFCVSLAVMFTSILSMVTKDLHVYRPASDMRREEKERVLLFPSRDGSTLMVLAEADSLVVKCSHSITGWMTSLSTTPTTHVRDSAWPGVLLPFTTMSTVGAGRSMQMNKCKEMVHFTAAVILY